MDSNVYIDINNYVCKKISDSNLWVKRQGDHGDRSVVVG